MIEKAEEQGRIKPGDHLIEPTSGNTGIGIAMAAAIKGYKAVITMPDKMSQEKVNCLHALGAKVVKTPTEAGHDDPESYMAKAADLKTELNGVILNQYSNPDNILAHYHTTAEEIWRDCEGRLDAVVIGAGTGGTVSGVGKRLKELDKKIRVIGVDPVGSILSLPAGHEIEPSMYDIEGIGYDFIPDALKKEFVDEWVRTLDADSFMMARRLIKDEGLLVGGSSGSAMWAAVQIGKSMPKGSRIVVILPDSIRNYLFKFADDRWMTIHGYLNFDDENVQKKADLSQCLVKIDPITKKTVTCTQAIEGQKLTQEWTLIVDYENNPYCVVQKSAVLKKVLDGLGEEFIERCGKKEFRAVDMGSLDKAHTLNCLATGYPVYAKDERGSFFWIDPAKATPASEHVHTQQCDIHPLRR